MTTRPPPRLPEPGATRGAGSAGEPASLPADPNPAIPNPLEGLPPRPAAIAQAPLLVAFSGGLDSTVLLHALKQKGGAPIRALHVHHGLQEAADAWARHCDATCEALGIECHVRRVRVDPDDPAGPEAAARAARYAALRDALDPGECLVTAHHRDDQAETLLLRLLRGSGADGLAAMRELSEFRGEWLWRPLLELPRSELRDYAAAWRLSWIEDPQNQDERYARSWLRARILPALRERFPQMDRSLARAARLLAEASDLGAELAALDLKTGSARRGFPIAAAADLDPARRNNLLRHWLKIRGFIRPDAAMLARLWAEVALAEVDAEPCLHWAGCEIRRFRGELFAMAPLPPPPLLRTLDWRRSTQVELPPGCGRLLASTSPTEVVSVGFMRGGERFQAAGQGQSKSLKNVFQEAAVPPWERLRTPLLRFGGGLAQVGNLGQSSAWQAFCASRGFTVRWQSPFL